ncbi:MAG: M14 metallopeptidase family protein [Bryobacteraceae bacterium]
MIRFMLRKRFLAILLWVAVAFAAVPTPQEHLGYVPGEDYKLADYADVIGYFKKLAAGSDRIRLVEFGKSAHGKAMYVAFLSSSENLRRLDRYREISRRLALGQATPEEARALAKEGRSVVWIDSGLHASEVAPVQHAPELAWRMVTGETDEIRKIRENVILMQIPVINPDGLDWIAHWYRKNIGTPYELAPLPQLYQKYAGHDNNRDWFMLNLTETRHVTRLLFREWFPHIVYNQHQAPAFPARIFIPPYAEPLNPHIPAPVMEGINIIGATMKERFAREEKPGILSYHGFDAWWNGGLRSVPAFHNMHGILTETALNVYATPRVYEPKEFPDNFANGIPTREPSVFYQRPWMGGKWGVREAIEYMLTADFAILDLAAVRRSDYLLKSYQLARASIEAGQKGNPFAYVIPAEQWDRGSALDMLERLSLSGVQVRRADAPFQAGGKSYGAGAFVISAGQPFRPYLMDLLEPQKYPELRAGTSGPTKRPYDVAGWTLSMNMGVGVDRIDKPFEASLKTADLAYTPGLDHRENASFVSVAERLSRGQTVRWAADGTIVTDSNAPAAFELRQPRVALYEPWVSNMDQGWTQWVLDRYQVPYTLIHNEDFQKGGLQARFDTVILAAQTAASILHGHRSGEVSPGRAGQVSTSPPAVQRPEYSGGIGSAGLANLQKFVQEGGTLIALDSATELPIQFFPLPVRNVVRSSSGEGTSGFYCPGSILRATVETAHPLAFGMPKDSYIFSSGGTAFEIALAPEYNKEDREVRSVVRFAGKNLLASGWLSGEKVAAGKHALLEARHGAGKVVLFGFRPQFRGQSFGTFKLLLNAIYLGSARKL